MDFIGLLLNFWYFNIFWIPAHNLYSTKQEVLQYTGGKSEEEEEE